MRTPRPFVRTAARRVLLSLGLAGATILMAWRSRHIAAMDAVPGAQVLAGVVRVSGDPPLLRGAAAKGVPDDSFLVDEQGGLANVFVWIRKPTAPHPPVDATHPIALTTKDLRFKPHAFILPVGGTILVKNDDARPQNVHTYGVRNSSINCVIAAGQDKGVLLPGDIARLPEPVPVKIGSDHLPGMSAYMFIVDHPFAAVTDANGRFEIAGLSPGEHQFVLWHERVGYIDLDFTITIGAEPRAETELSYDLSRVELMRRR